MDSLNRTVVFKFILQATSILGVYLFFTGWAYVYSYFFSFGLSLSALNLPLYYFFIYSFNVLVHLKILILFVLSGLYFILTSGKRIRYDKVLILADVVVLIAMFPLLYLLASDIGYSEAKMRKKSEDKSLPTIEFELKKEMSNSNQLTAGNKDCSASELRLLLFNNNIFYVFYPAKEDQKGCDSVYLIPKETLSLVKIVPPESINTSGN